MILTKDMLTKASKKGRLEAIALLNDFARVCQLPDPHYEYKASGTTKRRWHYFNLRFRVPKFMQEADEKNNMYLFEYSRNGDTVFGSGRDTNKQFAKSLAALEVIHRIEEALDIQRGDMPNVLAEYQEEIKQKQAALEATPVTLQIQGVSWFNLPMDVQFPEASDRKGRIIFSHTVRENPMALLGARAMTLSCKEKLPQVQHHSNHRDYSAIQNWANIMGSGKIKGITGLIDKELLNLSKADAELVALEKIGKDVSRQHSNSKVSEIVDMLQTRVDSFGMAKLFVRLPKHRFGDIKQLVDDILSETLDTKNPQRTSPFSSLLRHKKRNHDEKSLQRSEKALKRRIASFRSHQKKLSLPVDQVEKQIPCDDDTVVTIVRGGTGSGKTTRYPLMLSLFDETCQKIVVAQPRRLACQAAARRVAFEQDFTLGQPGCPIGYSIRFESKPSSSNEKSIDFETPGVILRRAAQDPLLSGITHLVIDEVHERNADIDLLLALAKQAQAHRRNHPTLQPLHIALMSATLETYQWETYFDENGKVAVVDVPDVRRFPIDIVHVGDRGFPRKLNWLQKVRRKAGDDLDEDLCQACAELILQLLQDGSLGKGSILCFLPGMDEIKSVSRRIQKRKQNNLNPAKVCILHSSVASKEQARVFQPGSKIILSTNIAETSLTIPDVKIVIDSGRERQYSLLDSSSRAANTSVVGSQLATVDISQASAKQRAGRAGRVSAGTCYRLYTREDLESTFTSFTLPEMQRMDLSQLVLHSLSLYHPSSGNPLGLLLGAPDPPSPLRLRQTLFAMSQQNLVILQSNHHDLESMEVDLTRLGHAVAGVPASPRIGRMLFLGLALRAIDSALTIAALLSVPKAFNIGKRPSKDTRHNSFGKDKICSDVVVRLLAVDSYIAKEKEQRKMDPARLIFEQILRVRRQLEQSMKDHLPSSTDWEVFNSNNSRVAAQAALICGATPHIAHLIAGKGEFATRDTAHPAARMHPASVNFDNGHRTHWYLYNELRTTKMPYLHVTTAASPLELALFCDSSAGMPRQKQKDSTSNVNEADNGVEEWPEESSNNRDEWLYIADQWVPVSVSTFPQRVPFIRLRSVLNNHMLNHVASDPEGFVGDSKYEQLVLNIFSCIEEQRIPK